MKSKSEKTKNSILFAATVLLSGHLFAQTTDPTDNMQNVKSLHTYYYEVYDVEMKKGKVRFYKKRKTLFHSLFEYDTNGNQTLKNYYNPSTDKLHESYVYTYDSNNRMTGETYILQGRILGGKTLHFYDKEGRKSQTEIYNNKEELKHRIRYAYDSLGNLATEQTRNSVNMVIKELEYQYDERGNQIEVVNRKTSFLRSNEPYREIKSYDSLNRLISRIHYKNDVLEWTYTATYNADNQLVMEQTTDGRNKVMSEVRYAYDKKDRLSETVNFEASHPAFSPMRTVYSYNKKGQNDKRTIYVRNSPTPSVTRHYYFDEHGNWTMWLETNHVDGEKAIGARRVVYF